VRAIAEELGVPEGTVKSRLHTAVRALRDRLHEDEVV
jgi:RNA polymerase sigma-70 factor (ECF subfamily)